MKKLIYILVVLTSGAAWADANCDWAIQVQKDGPGHIAQFNAIIAGMQKDIQDRNNTISIQLTPHQNGLNSEIGVYDTSINALRDSQAGIKNALLFVEEVIINNNGLKRELDQLKRSIAMDENQSLSDQISEEAKKGKMPKETRDKLSELAKMVALLETSQKDWQASEQGLLQDYLSGKTPLSEGLYNELSQLNEHLTANLTNFQNGRDADSIQLKAVTDDIAKAQATIAADTAEIVKQQGNIIGQQKYMAAWSPDKYCPRPDIQPHLIGPVY